MKRLASLLVLLGILWVGSPAKAGVLALDLNAGSGSLLTNPTWVSVGWRFSVLNPVTVSALGFWDQTPDGLGTNVSFLVTLWTSAGAALASASINDSDYGVGSTNSAAGRWLFEDIASLTLAIGDYVLGAAGDFSSHGARNVQPITTHPDITWLQGRFSNTENFPTTDFGNPPAAFGPNMLISNSTVPEPDTLALLALALGGLAYSRRRRAR